MQSIGGDLARLVARRILATLGSQMVEPAIARTVDIHPFLVPPEYTTTRRSREVAAMTKRSACTR